MANYPIREDWEDYYKTLEEIRQFGTCNMFGAGPYLKEAYPDLTIREAHQILFNWMYNYKALSEKYGWKN